MLCNGFKSMPRVHSLNIAFSAIEAFFDSMPVKAYTYKRLAIIIDDNKVSWNIDFRKSAKYVIDYLLKRGVFFESEIFGSKRNSFQILSWKTQDELTIISGIKWQSYFMYYTAISMHGLTLQIPKTVYLNSERNTIATFSDRSDLSQADIDEAFSKEQRKSENMLAFNNKNILLLNSGYTGRLGIISVSKQGHNFYYTDLERTLIDIVVRPAYSGGVFEVLESYRKAKGRLDVKKLFRYLKKLNYIYPYHQSIGFYLEVAGYPEEDCRIFECEMLFDFYLTYNIKNKSYSNRWRLFYPKGI
jgi:hypothetical protein